jgi:hypothetical protein
MVDVETDGPIPGDYSMISFGAVLVNDSLDKTFYARVKPISTKFIPDALAISGHTREETLGFEDPVKVMSDFDAWIKDLCKDRAIFISDNNGFACMSAGTLSFFRKKSIWTQFAKPG